MTTFKQLRNLDGTVSTTTVQYTDDQGTIWTVPLGSGNRLETLMDAWIAQGNAVVPADPVPVVIPQSVTPFQAKAALLSAGYMPQVNALMADPTTPPMYVLAWNEASVFNRESPTVLALAAKLGMTSAQLDQLFTQAATITA